MSSARRLRWYIGTVTRWQACRRKNRVLRHCYTLYRMANLKSKASDMKWNVWGFASQREQEIIKPYVGGQRSNDSKKSPANSPFFSKECNWLYSSLPTTTAVDCLTVLFSFIFVVGVVITPAEQLFVCSPCAFDPHHGSWDNRGGLFEFDGERMFKSYDKQPATFRLSRIATKQDYFTDKNEPSRAPPLGSWLLSGSPDCVHNQARPFLLCPKEQQRFANERRRTVQGLGGHRPRCLWV